MTAHNTIMLEAGSKIAGTLQDDNLTECFITQATILRCVACQEFSATVQSRVEGDDFDWYWTEACNFLSDNHVPDGYFFGAHPNDHYTYGVWKLEAISDDGWSDMAEANDQHEYEREYYITVDVDDRIIQHNS